MDDATLLKFRDRLDQEAANLRAADGATAEDRAPVTLDQQSVGRLSRMDALQQQAMAAAQSRRRAARLKAIEAALRRIDNGDFGYCDGCGEAIVQGRLDLDPCATRCVECARG